MSYQLSIDYNDWTAKSIGMEKWRRSETHTLFLNPYPIPNMLAFSFKRGG